MKKSLYMKILVAIDGSDYSNKALLHACNIARTQQSKLILIYVIEKSTLNLLDKKEYLRLVKDFGKTVLEKAQKTCIQHGIESNIILKEGNVANEIIKHAKTENCNLIIMGNRGFGATTRFLLGSVSQKVAANSPCSILIIK